MDHGTHQICTQSKYSLPINLFTLHDSNLVGAININITFMVLSSRNDHEGMIP